MPGRDEVQHLQLYDIVNTATENKLQMVYANWKDGLRDGNYHLMPPNAWSCTLDIKPPTNLPSKWPCT